jgi:hypothetical protein
MTEKLKGFVATGYRRMGVAVLAVGVVAYVEGVDTLSQWGAVALIGVTLGYFSSKFVEMVSDLVPVLLEWLRGRK